MKGKSLVPCGIPTPDRPARTVVAIPTTLFPLTVVVMMVVGIYFFFFLIFGFFFVFGQIF